MDEKGFNNTKVHQSQKLVIPIWYCSYSD